MMAQQMMTQQVMTRQLKSSWERVLRGALLCAAIALLFGCSAVSLMSGGGQSVVPVLSVVESPYGMLRLEIRWPERDLRGFRAALIPTSTNALQIAISKASQPIDTRIVTRQAGAATVSVDIPLKADTNLSVVVKAFRQAAPDPAVDEAVAQGSGVFNIVRSKDTALTIKLDPTFVPAITGFSLNAAPAGDTITVSGVNLGQVATAVSTVTFNGATASVVTPVSSTSLQVVVPAGATSGKVVVTNDGVPSTSNAVFWVPSSVSIAATKAFWDSSDSTKLVMLSDMSTATLTFEPVWAVAQGGLPGGQAPAPSWTSSNPAAGTLSAGTFVPAGGLSATQTTDVAATYGSLSSNVIEVTARKPSTVQGVLSTDIRWTLAGSPYVITGNTGVPQGVTLTIDPGVSVLYKGAYQIQVNGKLIANGNADQPISFNSFDGSSVLNSQFLLFQGDLEQSALSHVKMANASKAIALQTSGNTNVLTVSDLQLDRANVETLTIFNGPAGTGAIKLRRATISNATIRSNYAYGAPISIEDSTVSASTVNADNYSKGITVSGSKIERSTLYMGCCSSSIWLLKSVVRDSTFAGCCGSPVNGTVRIEDSVLGGTKVSFPSAQASVSNSVFIYNGAASEAAVEFGNGTLASASIVTNAGVSLRITGYSGYDLGGTFTVRDSTIGPARVGIQIGGARDGNAVKIVNSILGGTTYVIENKTSQAITATGNYWVATDSAVIDAWIWDANDDLALGRVNFAPFLLVAPF